MPLVNVMLVDNQYMGEFYFTKDQVQKAREFLNNGVYKTVADFFLNEENESAAEEVFDLTNNPNRQYEREKYYGRKRSVSVGDIIEVDGVKYLCCSFGWKAI